MKDGLAVQVAIRLKDLSLVKMLIEPLDVAKPTSPSEDLPHSHNKVEIRRPRSEDDVNRKKSTKKRKLEDRGRCQSSDVADRRSLQREGHCGVFHAGEVVHA